MKRSEIPRSSIIYGEVGVRLLELDEQEKAYELFVMAGNFALNKVLDNPAPLITEPIKEERDV